LSPRQVRGLRRAATPPMLQGPDCEHSGGRHTWAAQPHGIYLGSIYFPANSALVSVVIGLMVRATTQTGLLALLRVGVPLLRGRHRFRWLDQRCLCSNRAVEGSVGLSSCDGPSVHLLPQSVGPSGSYVDDCCFLRRRLSRRSSLVGLKKRRLPATFFTVSRAVCWFYVKGATISSMTRIRLVRSQKTGCTCGTGTASGTILITKSFTFLFTMISTD
jgi:hypothetical protein